MIQSHYGILHLVFFSFAVELYTVCPVCCREPRLLPIGSLPSGSRDAPIITNTNRCTRTDWGREPQLSNAGQAAAQCLPEPVKYIGKLGPGLLLSRQNKKSGLAHAFTCIIAIVIRPVLSLVTRTYTTPTARRSNYENPQRLSVLF